MGPVLLSCPTAAPLHRPLPHFKLQVVPCPSLLWDHTPPLPASCHALPVCLSPILSTSSPPGGLLHVPPCPTPSGTPGPRIWVGCCRGGLAACLGPHVLLPCPTTRIHLATPGGILLSPCPTGRTPPWGLSRCPQHRTPREPSMHTQTDRGGLLCAPPATSEQAGGCHRAPRSLRQGPFT